MRRKTIQQQCCVYKCSQHKTYDQTKSCHPRYTTSSPHPVYLVTVPKACWLLKICCRTGLSLCGRSAWGEEGGCRGSGYHCMAGQLWVGTCVTVQISVPVCASTAFKAPLGCWDMGSAGLRGQYCTDGPQSGQLLPEEWEDKPFTFMCVGDWGLEQSEDLWALWEMCVGDWKLVESEDLRALWEVCVGDWRPEQTEDLWDLWEVCLEDWRLLEDLRVLWEEAGEATEVILVLWSGATEWVEDNIGSVCTPPTPLGQESEMSSRLCSESLSWNKQKHHQYSTAHSPETGKIQSVQHQYSMKCFESLSWNRPETPPIHDQYSLSTSVQHKYSLSTLVQHKYSISTSVQHQYSINTSVQHKYSISTPVQHKYSISTSSV